MFKIIGQTLYQVGLHREQHSIADESQIDYHHTKDTVKAALDIVNLVAVDLPITVPSA